MSWDLYVRLSVMMFLEFAVWGAWAPVLAARLLGPLKMSGKQTGWIYATLPLGCIISPLVAGQLADKYVNTEWILAGAHLVGAVLLMVAVTQRKFVGLFVVMLLYSLCYAATLPLVNSLLFAQLAAAKIDPARTAVESGKVFIMAPIAWALVGYFLTGLRQTYRQEGDGRDCLILAGVLSVLMGVACLFLPATPPPAKGDIPVLQALGMLQDGNFLIFIMISMVVAGLMQFYFLGTAQFMQDLGIPGRNVPAAMGVAQAAQAVATVFALGSLISQLGYKWDLIALVGYKWTLTFGAACWLLLYVIYVRPSRVSIVLAQALHGIAYVTFIIAGQIYAGQYAPPEIGASVQALYFATALGVGLFVFTQMAGLVMDRFSADGKFQWQKIWMVPLVIMALGVLALIVGFQGTLPK